MVEQQQILQKHTYVSPERQVSQATLGSYIAHFDANWNTEGLPQDWYKFKGIGFNMESQMNLLQATDENSKKLFEQQTRMDMLGFALEYLSGGLVYTFKYHVASKPDGTRALFDEVYKKFMMDTASREERGGTVVDAMEKEQEFFLNENTPNGAMTVRISPKGPSGIKDSEGNYIDYPDSYIFISQKKKDSEKGMTVEGTTIKTDFNLIECREVIKRLTGKDLPYGASLQDFNQVLQRIIPSDRRDSLQSPADVIGLLQSVRDNNNAFKDQAWDEVYNDIGRREDLYTFNKNTQDAMRDFTEYVSALNISDMYLYDARLELKKATAATLLRISKHFMDEKRAKYLQASEKNYFVEKKNTLIPQMALQGMNYGEVFSEVKKIEGCAGGGASQNESTSIFSQVNRSGRKTGNKEDKSSWFTCPKCESAFQPPVGDSCPGCHYSKNDFIKEHPELAC